MTVTGRARLLVKLVLILWMTPGQVDTSPAKGSWSFQHWSNWQQTPGQLDTSPVKCFWKLLENCWSRWQLSPGKQWHSNPVDNTSQILFSMFTFFRLCDETKFIHWLHILFIILSYFAADAVWRLGSPWSSAELQQVGYALALCSFVRFKKLLVVIFSMSQFLVWIKYINIQQHLQIEEHCWSDELLVKAKLCERLQSSWHCSCWKLPVTLPLVLWRRSHSFMYGM